MIFIRTKLEASIDQHKTYEKTISDAKETVKKNDRAYNVEVKKRDATRSDTASLKLKVNFFILIFFYLNLMFVFIKLTTLMNDRERIQHEIQRLNYEFDQARLEEKTREDHRQQEIDVLQSSVSKREEKLDKIIKKEREKTTLIDEDERKLEKITM